MPEERLKTAEAQTEAAVQASPKPGRKGGVVVPNAPRWRERFAAWVVCSVIRLLSATVHFKLNDRSGSFERTPPGPVIYCVWHNRLALSMRVYFGFAKPRNPTAGLAAMVSASKDGALLAAILECFKVQPVRGSTSRRGPQALLELTTWANRGYDLAITPDGPRGPCYVVQDGVMSLAQITGRPIVPLSFQLSRKFRAKSWDRFQVPLPFSTCEINVGQPLRVPRDISDEARQKLRLQLEASLKELSWD